ncbi:MAG: dihydropteroate synthase [Peptoniphilaceae bacterium]|nr:dihydropteroate synthase [Peptoniphilaceae bacterium]MDD7382974.1 dihydropteroate synthase [Peptoniphilaceae bacterium]MDY3737725.1 dihydropteroate synthase [Peptoniphilaceae bacterium]
MKIGKYDFDFENECYIMGILNVTPDSFSDGGEFNNIDKALFHVEEMINDGAKIIDVGGYSTRPGHEDISIEEEIERVVPVAEKIKKNFDICISIDTFNSKVFDESAKVGAEILNDVSGLKYDKDMAKIAKKHNSTIVIMTWDPPYNENIVEKVYKELEDSIKIAQDYNIENIIVDPGVGFSRGYDGDFELVSNLDYLKKLNRPILLGTSNKRFLRKAINTDKLKTPIATSATTVSGVLNGASIFRVHDVKTNLIAMKIAQEIKKHDRHN